MRLEPKRDVMILVDFEEGHVLPTFRLARGLAHAGWRVRYCGIADMEALVRRNGFEFVPVLEDAMPLGFGAGLRASAAEGDVEAAKAPERRYFAQLVSGQMLDRALADPPSLMLVHSLFVLEGIVINCRYGVPVAFLCPHIPISSRRQRCTGNPRQLLSLARGVNEYIAMLRAAGHNIHGVQQLFLPALAFPELLMFPAEFDLPGADCPANTHYIGSGADLDRSAALNPPGASPSFHLDERPLVYCALGSQSHLRADASLRIYRATLDVAARRQELQFIVAIGRVLKAEQLGPCPANVRLIPWAPQAAILQRASLAITHAGLGTASECILTGVPMVATPLMRDQFQCARRIEYHRAGIQVTAEPMCAPALERAMLAVLQSQEIRAGLVRMRTVFERTDPATEGVRVLNNLMEMPHAANAPLVLREACV